jgi:ribosomal protein S18 acetylase RimI-like enzyme
MNHIQTAGEILADAFLHYPLITYAFEGKSDEARKRNLLHLYTNCTKACSEYGGIELLDNSKGALIWLSGENFPLGLWKEIQSGMAAIPFNIGPKAMLRLMNHDAVPETWIKKNAGEKFGYIWCLGVLADERSKGWSRMLVEQSITEMKKRGINQFWLKTEDPKNVLIYNKMGFVVMYETEVKSSGIRSWVMKKQ